IGVVEASDAPNALERARNRSFDIVMLPEALEKMSGSFLIQKIEEIKSMEPPKHYLLVHDPAKGELPKINLNNLTVLPPQADAAALEEVFKKVLVSTAKAPSTPRRAAFKMDVNFINPFIESTIEVLAKTCNTKAKKTKVFIRDKDTISGDISALVGMVSPTFKGSMGIAFERTTFIYVANNMLGEKATQITTENQDAAGEICNQVFGRTKTVLNEMGHAVQPAIPSVIVGDRHRVKHLVDGPVIAVQFETEGGYFIVEATVV
ncbi:MAG TPA: chemotaxis protein CheX, partial [Pseudobdellovibrionaceae bacterium]|nr:chemotaxis protein CheX [Pseudobdellovibrionaceae bacterium]